MFALSFTERGKYISDNLPNSARLCVNYSHNNNHVIIFFLFQLEREAIFTVLCGSQNVDITELDLKVLVQFSDGFTGADVNAAITLARLSAFEDALATATVSVFVY